MIFKTKNLLVKIVQK